MNEPIRIEPAHPEDTTAILEVHSATVHQTAAPFYPEIVINSWARLPITSDRIERVKQKWIENPEHCMVVAKQNNQIVGFGFIAKNIELQGFTFTEILHHAQQAQKNRVSSRKIKLSRHSDRQKPGF